ncbi:hypothetical protein [Paenibacillus sp. DYY-L-2]|uniref:hypothetical protein n=1 Tax=Paenibacillus sp. DYY-L-2 TaxID=3447013 RepID=UPI003F505CBC
MDPKEILPIFGRLEENSIPYALGGSGLLYYLNLMDSANDWDITVDCPKDKLIKAIGGYEWEERSTGDFPFASKYRLSVYDLMGRKEKADLILNYLNTNKEVANTEVIHDLIRQLGQTNNLAQELKKLIL